MPYTAFDRLVARRRFRAAAPHIRAGSQVCDIGCGLDAPFLALVSGTARFSVGVDYQPTLRHTSGVHIVRADITCGLPFRDGQFDHATMLAVLEHLPRPQTALREASRVLASNGSLILTWPSGIVDPVLNVLHRVGLVSDEMESSKHERRVPLKHLLAQLREIGFARFEHRLFEFGLNNLLIAYKS